MLVTDIDGRASIVSLKKFQKTDEIFVLTENAGDNLPVLIKQTNNFVAGFFWIGLATGIAAATSLFVGGILLRRK